MCLLIRRAHLHAVLSLRSIVARIGLAQFGGRIPDGAKDAPSGLRADRDSGWCGGDRDCCAYMNGMTSSTPDILRRIETWPQEDQEELAELAREIEARRTGVYRATQEELRALDEAERSGTASDEEVEAAFKRFRRE
jgi:hypothetical protein